MRRKGERRRSAPRLLQFRPMPTDHGPLMTDAAMDTKPTPPPNAPIRVRNRDRDTNRGQAGHMLNFRVSRREKRQIDDTCEKRGINLSTLVRFALWKLGVIDGPDKKGE